MRKLLTLILLLSYLIVHSQDCSQIGADIFGEGSFDAFGSKVSLSSDGNTVAIGSSYNNSYTGHVRVHRWNGSSWGQLGSDIDGDSLKDYFGSSVSISSNGNIVAIGATSGSSVSDTTGYVKIYSWNGSNWSQLGTTIYGNDRRDYFGTSISLSSDGNTVAIGANGVGGAAPNGAGNGYVKIYNWDGSIWNQLGQDIEGEAQGDLFGCSLSLNSTGNTIVVGAEKNDGTDTDVGHARVYSWDGSSWNQVGNDIDGENYLDEFGSSVSISSDGNTVAISSMNNVGTGTITAMGHVRVLDWDGNNWIQLGADIDGESSLDFSGSSISLSDDGNILAIGAMNNSNSNNSLAGHTRIYSWDGLSWEQVGNDIDGEGENDSSGSSVSLSSDGSIVAIGAPFNLGNGNTPGHVRLFETCTSSNTDNINSNIANLTSVTPNPSNKQIIVLGNGTVNIIDATGKTVYQNTILHQSTINVSTYNKGLYYVRIVDGDRIENHKLIIE